MIRRTCRRAAFVVGAAAVLTAAGFPVLSGTAHAATVTPAPSSAANAGDVSVTLTAGVTISTATGATLTKSDDPSVKIDATSLSNPGQPSFTQRVATFPLLNKLPGHYDITVTESGGTESCAACFTISGLPPTVHLSPPTAIVVNSTATGTLTVTNPARGSVYPKIRVKLDISGDPGLTANQMTLTAASGATNFPTQLMDSGGDVIAFV